jgi:hypothetical protein
MNTHQIEEADAKYLGCIGVVLLAATMITGIVLISSLPPGQSLMLSDTPLLAPAVTGDMRNVLLSYDLKHLDSNSGSLSGERFK